MLRKDECREDEDILRPLQGTQESEYGFGERHVCFTTCFRTKDIPAYARTETQATAESQFPVRSSGNAPPFRLTIDKMMAMAIVAIKP